MLSDPQRHEALTDAPWSGDAARAAAAAIARDTVAAFDAERLWPTHRLDLEDNEPQSLTMLYFGAAGVIWALDRLARAGVAEARHDYASLLDNLVARNTAQVEPWGHGVESLLMGRAGNLLLQ